MKAILAVVLFSTLCAAQGRLAAPTPPRANPVGFHETATKKSPRLDWKFVGFLAAATAANVADLVQTENCLHRIGGCSETNPAYGPHPSAAKLYGISFAIEAGYALGSYELRRHGPKPLRKSWWVPLAYVGYGHIEGIATSKR